MSSYLPFSIEFVSARTIRLRAASRFQVKPDQESLMLVNEKAPNDTTAWQFSNFDGGFKYTSAYGSVTISKFPWRVEIRDASGKILTHTVHNADGAETFMPVLPFSFIDKVLHKISVVRRNGNFAIESDPFAGKVGWEIRLYSK